MDSVPFTFLGADRPAEGAADVVIAPVAYEATTSYGRGTALAPEAIISASRSLELYSIRTGINFDDFDILTLDELQPDGIDPYYFACGLSRHLMEVLSGLTSSVTKGRPFLVTLGGEHTVTLGAVSAIEASHPKKDSLAVVVFDAHSDMRDKYMGGRYGHACVGRRLYEKLGVDRFLQVGVRSSYKEFVPEVILSPGEDLIHRLQRMHLDSVYVSVDLDVLDSSCISTGYPEPFGMSMLQLRDYLRFFATNFNLLGVDFVEFVPSTREMAVGVAGLIYDLISSVLSKQVNAHPRMLE